MPTLRNVLLLGEKLHFTMDWLLRGEGAAISAYPLPDTTRLMVSEPDDHQQELEAELSAHAKATNGRGMHILIEHAADLAKRFPKDQAKAA